MKASLQVVVEGVAGRKIDLREGHVAQFGRTDWADFSFRDDAAMADVHFAVDCARGGCTLRSLVTDRDTLVNDEKAEEVALHTGDRITAGKTTFIVTIDGEAAPQAAIVAGAATIAAASAQPPATDFVKLCTYLELADALPVAEANPALSRDEFLQKLVTAKLLASALRLRAHWLPKRAAVWWGCLCVREACGGELPPEQEAAWQAAKQWVAEHDEPARRRAEAALEQAGFSGPGGMLASAAFGAGESIAPPESSVAVPPDPRTTGHAVATALLFAAYHRDPKPADERRRWFLDLAQDVAAGKITLPDR